MGLSSDLISQFVKVTKDDKKTKKETTTYGTIVNNNGTKCVQLDGSDIFTPLSSVTKTADVDVGDRVTVLIKNHTATITGNLSNPSATYIINSNNETEKVIDKITDFEIAIGEKASVKDLTAEVARVDELLAENGRIYNLEVDNVDIKKSLEARKAEIEDLQAEDVTITGKLNANAAEITSLKTQHATFENATAKNFEAVNGDIYNLNTTYTNVAGRLTATEGVINSLDSNYANIDFTNIGKAAMEHLYSESGLIKNVVIGDTTITGELVGVTISGDLIKGNTVKADKLVVKGSDGLYYKLNIDAGATTTEEVTDTDLQNGLHGSAIIAKTITATQIKVGDLVAFDATIGGFNIKSNALHSSSKTSATSTTRGIYLDNDGQLAVGDSSNYLRYYKDSSGNYKLEISAVDKLQIGGRNLIRDSRMNADTDLWKYDYNHHSISFTNGYAEIVREYDATYINRTFNNQHSEDNPLLMPDEISGKTYILQAELKAPEGIVTSAQSSLFYRVYYDDSNNYEEITLYIPEDLSSTEWRRCYASHTFGTRNWTNSKVTIALANLDNGICVRNMMLERATKPSTWSPAPEDLETKITNAETKIIQNANSITAVATRTTNNESAIASLELTADGLTAKVDAAKKQKYHETSGTAGTAGYVGIGTLKVTNNYTNRPILFELTNRGQQSSNISFCFANVNSTDPGLQHIQSDGGINVWAYKSATSTWHLIVQKSEAYDTIYVKDFSNTNNGVTVTWTSVHYDALPTSNITAATRLAAKLTKDTVDNAAKTATNYLNFSTSGLVVGDMTANTLGKNVRISSSTVDIREGSTTLASFGADTIYLGKNSETAVINLCNGSATMRSVDDTDFKIYTDKRLVMSAYSSALLDCWRDSTHMTRISMQSADPDASYMWGGILCTIYQDTIKNTFDMSGNTTEFKIINGTTEATVDLNETRFRIQANNTQINCTNGLYIGYDGDYKACITLGYDYLQPKRIIWYWSDNALHDAISNDNGQTTYFGPGDIGEATTTYIRGKYVRLYGHNGGGVYLGSSGSTAITSDRNLKTDILDINDKYIDFFDRLRPITYKYNDGHRDHVGFIAQEVEEALIASGLTTEEFAGLIIENDVTLNPNYDSSMTDEERQANETHYDKLYSLRYEEFISLLVKKVQSLQEQINQLKETL